MEDRAVEFRITKKETSQEQGDMPMVLAQAVWLKSLSSDRKRKESTGQCQPGGRH